jgi:biotin synthase
MSTTVAQVLELYELPLNELMTRAAAVHHQNFPEGDIELATLLSIKTGGCPEDCGYCPQAARYQTDVKATKMMDVEEVLEAARAAKDCLLYTSDAADDCSIV